RAARLAAEKERDALKAELAELRSSTAPYAEAMKQWRASGWDGEPRTKLARLAPDAALKRLGTIMEDLEATLKKPDATKESELLRELAQLGRPAWPLIEKLVTTKREASAPP